MRSKNEKRRYKKYTKSYISQVHSTKDSNTPLTRRATETQDFIDFNNDQQIEIDNIDNNECKMNHYSLPFNMHIEIPDDINILRDLNLSGADNHTKSSDFDDRKGKSLRESLNLYINTVISDIIKILSIDESDILEDKISEARIDLLIFQWFDKISVEVAKESMALNDLRWVCSNNDNANTGYSISYILSSAFKLMDIDNDNQLTDSDFMFYNLTEEIPEKDTFNDSSIKRDVIIPDIDNDLIDSLVPNLFENRITLDVLKFSFDKVRIIPL